MALRAYKYLHALHRRWIIYQNATHSSILTLSIDLPLVCFYCQVLANAKRPVIIVGSNPLTSSEGDSLMAICSQISNGLKSQGSVDKDWKVLNVLHKVMLL